MLKRPGLYVNMKISLKSRRFTKYIFQKFDDGCSPKVYSYVKVTTYVQKQIQHACMRSFAQIAYLVVGRIIHVGHKIGRLF